jgi:hypothetical protein
LFDSFTLISNHPYSHVKYILVVKLLVDHGLGLKIPTWTGSCVPIKISKKNFKFIFWIFEFPYFQIFELFDSFHFNL